MWSWTNPLNFILTTFPIFFLRIVKFTINYIFFGKIFSALKKTKDKTNKSRNLLSLTDKGEELFEKINIVTCGWERDITKNFSNEKYFDFKQKLYKLVKESVNLG